jgi:hypothetical protein
MLSWSSATTGGQVDLAAVASGQGDTHVERGAELLRFASACAGDDDAELAAARSALVAASDESFMVDAAAVAGNFEMMTRLADSTGARMPADRLEAAAQAIGVMGADDFVSKR